MKMKESIPIRTPHTMLTILLPRVLYEMARKFMTVRRMMTIHMQKRRVMVRQVPLKDHDLVYSPKLRQLRDFQEPLGPSSMLVTPFMLGNSFGVFPARLNGW